MTTGALTQTKEEDKRERRDRDKAEERPDNGRSRVAVTGRYSTNAVAVPARARMENVRAAGVAVRHTPEGEVYAPAHRV